VLTDDKALKKLFETIGAATGRNGGTADHQAGYDGDGAGGHRVPGAEPPSRPKAGKARAAEQGEGEAVQKSRRRRRRRGKRAGTAAATASPSGSEG
jgi:hypothetical protein